MQGVCSGTFLFLLTCSALLRAPHCEASYFPCRNKQSDPVPPSLEDMIHTSDVVVSGMLIALKSGPRGTLTGTIYCYYPYKRDWGLLEATSLPIGVELEVQNFDGLAEIGRTGMFFMVREPNGELSLQCESGLSLLMRLEGLDSLLKVLRLVWSVGYGDTVRNYKLVPPTPDPCANNGPCSEQGSFCSSLNTLPDEPVRCTCLTGYVGDGFTCKDCLQCKYGAQCKGTEECSCSHFKCESSSKWPAWHQVCATNGVTFPSLCHLQREACLTQKPMYLLHKGNCELLDMEPCGDRSSLLLSSSGVVRCSGDLGGCPPMHFCHPTSLYSVCCQVAVAPNTATASPITSTSTQRVLPSVSATPTSIPTRTPSPSASRRVPTATPVPTAMPGPLPPGEGSGNGPSSLSAVVPTRSAVPSQTPTAAGTEMGSGEEAVETSGRRFERKAAYDDSTLWDDEDIWRHAKGYRSHQ